MNLRVNKLMNKPDACHCRGRRTGKSTAIALRILAEAIDNPNKWVPVVDHHDKRSSHMALLDKVQKLSCKLDLKFMIFNRQVCSVMFELYRDFSDSCEFITVNDRIYQKWDGC
jgi:hypothetical protein